ncbi:hypothetical protein BaRGS_00038028 [Batillaria attramentaria]|uniref:Uncharacterized protein n=1 Tax=Batillaria attramentaria TaxID=370345 RepID=A0ABD0J7G4_9CAEN
MPAPAVIVPLNIDRGDENPFSSDNRALSRGRCPSAAITHKPVSPTSPRFREELLVGFCARFTGSSLPGLRGCLFGIPGSRLNSPFLFHAPDGCAAPYQYFNIRRGQTQRHNDQEDKSGPVPLTACQLERERAGKGKEKQTRPKT